MAPCGPRINPERSPEAKPGQDALPRCALALILAEIPNNRAARVWIGAQQRHTDCIPTAYRYSATSGETTSATSVEFRTEQKPNAGQAEPLEGVMNLR